MGGLYAVCWSSFKVVEGKVSPLGGCALVLDVWIGGLLVALVGLARGFVLCHFFHLLDQAERLG